MSDSELLELAAKAAGWIWWKSKHGYWNVTTSDGESHSGCMSWPKFDPFTGEKLAEPMPSDAIAEMNWNPLTDDGDALRLAVKLDMSLVMFSIFVRVDTVDYTDIYEEYGTDRYAATRRAIVRAAAQIGEHMEKQNGN